VPIPPELEERVGKAWFESIPERYRYTDQTEIDRRILSSIIAPPPPKKLVETLFVQYEITDPNRFAITKVEMQCGPKRVQLIA
jgi:hypothetical protein